MYAKQMMRLLKLTSATYAKVRLRFVATVGENTAFGETRNDGQIVARRATGERLAINANV